MKLGVPLGVYSSRMVISRKTFPETTLVSIGQGGLTLGGTDSRSGDSPDFRDISALIATACSKAPARVCGKLQ